MLALKFASLVAGSVLVNYIFYVPMVRYFDKSFQSPIPFLIVLLADTFLAYYLFDLFEKKGISHLFADLLLIAFVLVLVAILSLYFILNSRGS